MRVMENEVERKKGRWKNCKESLRRRHDYREQHTRLVKWQPRSQPTAEPGPYFCRAISFCWYSSLRISTFCLRVLHSSSSPALADCSESRSSSNFFIWSVKDKTSELCMCTGLETLWTGSRSFSPPMQFCVCPVLGTHLPGYIWWTWRL